MKTEKEKNIVCFSDCFKKDYMDANEMRKNNSNQDPRSYDEISQRKEIKKRCEMG